VCNACLAFKKPLCDCQHKGELVVVFKSIRLIRRLVTNCLGAWMCTGRDVNSSTNLRMA
jgi:hypothetical protein